MFTRRHSMMSMQMTRGLAQSYFQLRTVPTNVPKTSSTMGTRWHLERRGQPPRGEHALSSTRQHRMRGRTLQPQQGGLLDAEKSCGSNVTRKLTWPVQRAQVLSENHSLWCNALFLSTTLREMLCGKEQVTYYQNHNNNKVLSFVSRCSHLGCESRRFDCILLVFIRRWGRLVTWNLIKHYAPLWLAGFQQLWLVHFDPHCSGGLFSQWTALFFQNHAAQMFVENVKGRKSLSFEEVDIEILKALWFKFEEMLLFFCTKEIPEEAMPRLLQTLQQQKSWCKKAGWHTVRAKAAAVCPATALVWKIFTTQSTIRWPRFSTGWLSGWPKPRVKGESPSSWSDARSWYALSCISWPSCECWSSITTSWTATSVTVISSWSRWTQTATTLSSLYPWLCTQNWIWDNKASVAGMAQVTPGLFKLEWEGTQMIVLCLKWYYVDEQDRGKKREV